MPSFISAIRVFYSRGNIKCFLTAVFHFITTMKKTKNGSAHSSHVRGFTENSARNPQNAALHPTITASSVSPIMPILILQSVITSALKIPGRQFPTKHFVLRSRRFAVINSALLLTLKSSAPDFGGRLCFLTFFLISFHSAPLFRAEKLLSTILPLPLARFLLTPFPLSLILSNTLMGAVFFNPFLSSLSVFHLTARTVLLSTLIFQNGSNPST